ncbi:hypothetical protein [Parendozoicomonas haliclonae]|uniref:HTH iclR-type domain-containing protein n=1 Tax=Parendozoicomonas haliclonae TaxID=1960125 RepID=A0A1X7AQY8_9GAMM|nr:hypothetical protein [Parendozoicomonas haliclonae]SMA50724.1 hypothetical protein EHSB41UT_04541 [Parendozoicomonas haliclonae]
MSSQPNQSLIDGIRCFQELASSDVPLGNAELAERLGINVVKANRLLMTLKSIGLAEQGSHKKYRPGPAIQLLAAQSFHGSHLYKQALSVLAQHQYPDRIVAMGVLWNDSVVYMYHASPGQAMHEALGGYRLYHATQSSIGQLFLADREDEALGALVEPLKPEEQERLLDNIRQIREQGISILFDTEKQSFNIAMKVTIDGSEAGLAFSDLMLNRAELDDAISQLHELARQIERNH